MIDRNILQDALGRPLNERATVRVCAPMAHAGVGDALRRAFSEPRLTSRPCEWDELLKRV